MICDWWISIRLVCFCVSRFVAFELELFEVVPIELPNPKETRNRYRRVKTNRYVLASIYNF